MQVTSHHRQSAGHRLPASLAGASRRSPSELQRSLSATRARSDILSFRTLGDIDMTRLVTNKLTVLCTLIMGWIVTLFIIIAQQV